MATLVNGSRIEWNGYEYGVENKKGEIIPCPTYEVARDVMLVDGSAKLKFRPRYVGEWSDANAPDS